MRFLDQKELGMETHWPITDKNLDHSSTPQQAVKSTGCWTEPTSVVIQIMSNFINQRTFTFQFHFYSKTQWLIFEDRPIVIVNLIWTSGWTKGLKKYKWECREWKSDFTGGRHACTTSPLSVANLTMFWCSLVIGCQGCPCSFVHLNLTKVQFFIFTQVLTNTW